MKSRLNRHLRLEVPFLEMDPAGHAISYRGPEAALDGLLVESLLVLQRPGQERRPAAVNG